MNDVSTSATHTEQTATQEWQRRPRRPGPLRREPNRATRSDWAHADLLAPQALRGEPAGPTIDMQEWLTAAGASTAIRCYDRGAAIYRQGEVGGDVCYIQRGLVKLSVLSVSGRDAVVAILGPGDYFGESCLAGQRWRAGTAAALGPSVILAVAKESLTPLLTTHPAMAAHFLGHLLQRNIRMEEDFVDQLCHGSEQRLARTLLLLADTTSLVHAPRVVPRLSQETLAEMVGTTRSRVNLFLNKFKKLGFIEYHGESPMTVNPSLTAALRD